VNPSLHARLLVLSTAALFALPTAQAAGAVKWTQPAILDGCPGTGSPYVVFPSDKPTHGTGPGAIVWSDSSPCPGGAGVRVATVSRQDTAGQPTRPRTAAGDPIRLGGPVAAGAGPYGRVVIAGASTGGPTGSAGGLAFSEGVAGGPFAPLIGTGGAQMPFALATAYLGDVALLSAGGDGVQLRIQRHHANDFATPVRVTGGGPVETLTVALDFRSDRLAVFSRRGSLYARELPGSGAPHGLQRLGPAPPSGAAVAAVASDDNRAIVAWSYRHAGQTSVYVSRSGTGVRFGSPQLLERFADPPGLPSYVDSPRIVRLASESVMMAWTGAEDGNWVIRSAAIDLGGVRSPSTISPPGRDALLAGLAPGPEDEALVLWTEPQMTPAGLDVDRQAIFAARGFDGYPGETDFAADEEVAPPGRNGEATIAVDPDSDQAVAAWRTSGGAIAYAIRAAGGR
jgi:hypothetical protein